MKFLYYSRGRQKDDESDTVNCNLFIPKIFGELLIPGEIKSVKLIASRVIFQILTLGKMKVFYVSDGKNLLHTSCVIPKCIKFPFMKKDDYEIGPCFTYPKYRGRGIYPSVLKTICKSIGNDNTTFYMIVDENNIPSINGIEKAGFKKCGIMKVNKFTKRYVLITKL